MGESYVCVCMQVCEILQFFLHRLLPRTPVSILTAPFPVGVLLYCYCYILCVCVCVCVYVCVMCTCVNKHYSFGLYTEVCKYVLVSQGNVM